MTNSRHHKFDSPITLKGFTLIDLLMGMALSTVVMTVLYFVYIGGSRAIYRTSALTQATHAANMIHLAFERDVSALTGVNSIQQGPDLTSLSFLIHDSQAKEEESGKQIKWEFRKIKGETTGRIFRNDRPVTNQKFKAASFHLGTEENPIDDGNIEDANRFTYRIELLDPSNLESQKATKENTANVLMNSVYWSGRRQALHYSYWNSSTPEAFKMSDGSMEAGLSTSQSSTQFMKLKGTSTTGQKNLMGGFSSGNRVNQGYKDGNQQ